MPIRTKQTGRAMRYTRWNGQPITRNLPRSKRHFRVLYWYKGDPSATWVKADIYQPNGKLMLSGLLAQNLQDLKRIVHEMRWGA